MLGGTGHSALSWTLDGAAAAVLQPGFPLPPAAGQVPALSCRLYRDTAGRLARAPSVEDLRRALEQAGVDS